MAFWKLLDHSYIQIVPSQQLRRLIDSSILRDTLQIYIVRTWINMRTKSFIKTSVDVTETKIDEADCKNISHRKLQAWSWKNILTKIETTFPLFHALLFLWNQVCKFNIVMIGNIFVISTIYLIFFAFFSLFDISQTLKFIQCVYAFYKDQ